MRFETLIAAVLVLSQVSAPVVAEPRDNAALPQFSAAETQTVNRNELLRVLIETDPWLVREILDAVAGRNAKNSEEFVAQALDGIDRATNPDIVSSTRNAAISLGWIELLRRAREEKQTIQGKQSAGRSAKGSIELLEVLRQAQKEKGGAK